MGAQTAAAAVVGGCPSEQSHDFLPVAGVARSFTFHSDDDVVPRAIREERDDVSPRFETRPDVRI